jgi:predicted RNA-binding Zn-ribbon protein involved in translation (DUF1610 family)
MKINKKECRKYTDPGLTFNKNDGLLLVKYIKYIVRTAIKNISGKRILTVHFYEREGAADNAAPAYTLFQCRDDYITLQRLDGGNIKWVSASLENLGGSYSDLIKKSAFYRKNDEKRVTKFCANLSSEGFDALKFLQKSIMNIRLTKRIKKREYKIIDRMKSVPPAPRGIKNWMRREILPHYVYYIYSGKKTMQGYCTACRNNVSVSGVKNCSEGKCPVCGKAVIFRASGRTKRIFDRLTFQVLQKSGGNELVLRIFKASNEIHDCRNPELSVWESARFFIRWDETGFKNIEPYYYSDKPFLFTQWKSGQRPRFSAYQYSFQGDNCGYIYCGNIDNALKDTPWQYSQLKQFYNVDGDMMQIIPYIKAYSRYPAIEYLMKFGLSKLVSQIVYKYDCPEVINNHGKNFRETLGIESEDLPLLKKINVDAYEFLLYKELKQQGVQLNEQFFMWCRQWDITSNENLEIALKYSTPEKLIRYIDEKYELLKEQKNKNGVYRYEKPNNVLIEYKDYLEMGGKIGYDFKDSFVLFPKNLTEAHDQASMLTNVNENKKYNKQIQEAYKNLLNQYHFTKDGLTLMPPKSAKEIVKEGHTLHHCVHSYVERVAEGRSVILFIRETENIKKPFYTLEIQDGEVSQIHGEYHCRPTPEVEKFLELWKNKKLIPAYKAEAA